MDADIVQKLILTSLLLNFVFGLGGAYCDDKRYYVLRDRCIFLLGVNGVFIFVLLILRVWM